MSGLFVILAVVIFASVILVKESNSNYRYQRRVRTTKNIADVIRVPSNVASELKNQMLDSNKKWGLLDSISGELTEIHGEKWKEVFATYDNLYDVYFYYGGALRILYAKSGYVDTYDLMGFRMNARTMLGEEFHKIHQEKMITTCKIIERELKKVHSDIEGLELWFVPDGLYDSIQKKYVFSDSLSSGHLEFAFTIHKNTRFYNPERKRLW